jgi:hypothetical protein
MKNFVNQSSFSMVNVSDDRYVPYLHFLKLRREGTQMQRGGKG